MEADQSGGPGLHGMRIPLAWEEADDTTIPGIRRRRAERIEAVRGTPLTVRERMLLKPASIPVSCEIGVLIAFIFLAIFFVTFVYRDEPPDKRILTVEELSIFDGERAPRIYIAILGQVFDVTRGRKHYDGEEGGAGPGGGYGFFAGKDASKAFVTGDFEGDLVDDVSSLSPEELKGLVDWRTFYQKHKEYKYVGRLAGRFYTALGSPTEELVRVERAASGVPDARPKEASSLNPPLARSDGRPLKGRCGARKVIHDSSSD